MLSLYAQPSSYSKSSPMFSRRHECTLVAFLMSTILISLAFACQVYSEPTDKLTSQSQPINLQEYEANNENEDDSNSDLDICFSCIEQLEAAQRNITAYQSILKKKDKYLRNQSKTLINSNNITFTPKGSTKLSSLNKLLIQQNNKTCNSINDLHLCVEPKFSSCIGDLRFHSLDVFAKQWLTKMNCTSKLPNNTVVKPFKQLTRSVPVTAIRELARPIMDTKIPSETQEMHRLTPLIPWEKIQRRVKDHPDSFVGRNGILVDGRSVHPFHHSDTAAIQQVILTVSGVSMLAFVVASIYAIRKNIISPPSSEETSFGPVQLI